MPRSRPRRRSSNPAGTAARTAGTAARTAGTAARPPTPTPRRLPAARRGDVSLAASASAHQQLRDRQLVMAQLELAIREQMVALELLCGAPIEGWE